MAAKMDREYQKFGILNNGTYIENVDLDVTLKQDKPWQYKVLKVYFDETYVDGQNKELEENPQDQYTRSL